MRKAKVIIVGGGLSGIACARKLQERDIDFLLIEASERLGGRVRTESSDGFLFDCGFQVFNSAYKNTAALLKDSGLKFHNFRAGALIKTNNGLHPLCDPFREPKFLLKTLFSPIGSFSDRLRMLTLLIDTLRSKLRSNNSIEKELLRRGFTSSMIEQFFRPFLGGVFLEKELQTCCEAFQSAFLFFSTGLAQLPVGGMEQIPIAIAKPLNKEKILLNCRVVSVSKNSVRLDDGEELCAEAVVLALNINSLQTLLPDLNLPDTNSVSNFYFESEIIPEISRFLVLNGKQSGIINNLVALSSVNPSYAPKGRELLSVSVIGESKDTQQVQKELQDWFPGKRFKFLKKYIVRNALPQQHIPAKQLKELDFHICGDALGDVSIEGAVSSGIKLGAM